MNPKPIAAGFAPLYINAGLLQDGKAAALLKFSRIFFPQLGPSILGLLLDMEGHSSRLIAGIDPGERDRLARELEGVSVELRYVIRDGGKEMLALPITLSPAEALKNAALGSPVSRDIPELQKKMDALLLSFFERELERKVRDTMENFMKTLLGKPKLPALLEELLERGLVNKDGRMAPGATIQDLTSGKYSGLFKKVISEEILNEALVVKETIKICCQGREEEYKSLIDSALLEKGVLEISLESIGKRNYSGLCREIKKSPSIPL